jgi:hypothetical protein
MMQFWCEVNKIWVAAGYGALLVPDPYDMTYEEVLAQVYKEVAEVKNKPEYQSHAEGCDRMHEAVERRKRAKGA